MPLVLPYTILAGQYVLSAPVRLNFQAIADKFNAGIVNADIAPANTANIDGTKLADNTIPGAKIVSGGIGPLQIGAGAVGTAALADSTGASDGVTTAKIATGAVTSAKLAAGAALANIGAANILTGNLKLVGNTVNFAAGYGNIGAGAVVALDLTSTTPAANVTTTQALAGTILPLLAVFSRAGAPAAPAGIVLGFARDTSAGKYYLIVSNQSGAVISLSSASISVTGIASV